MNINILSYNRFPMNDFPRLAVSGPAKTVSMVWNNARLRPTGDILLQSYTLASLTQVQSTLVRLDTSKGWHFLPALRNANPDGTINVSWYDRKTGSTTSTNVVAALRFSSTTTKTPANTTVTTAASNWLGTISDIVPNFGDYTDNYVIATGTAPYTGATIYVAWSDGRIGEPQPFEAHT